MIIVRNEGAKNMFGKKSLKSDNPYNKLMRAEALCEEYEEEIAALEDEVEALKKERDELQKELARYEWVSVDEKLPEAGTEVLVTDGLHTMVTWCENTNDGVKWVDNYYTYVNVRFKEVTHWMPLSEPPKENSNDEF